MNQPVPKISDADVERLVRREFPLDADKALAVLNEYGIKEYHREPARVKVAVLRMAGGDLKRLRSYVDLAKTDYRDVLAPAEYPVYFRTIGASSTQADKDRAVAEDWRQYSSWVRGG